MLVLSLPGTLCFEGMLHLSQVAVAPLLENKSSENWFVVLVCVVNRNPSFSRCAHGSLTASLSTRFKHRKHRNHKATSLLYAPRQPLTLISPRATFDQLSPIIPPNNLKRSDHIQTFVETGNNSI